MSDTSQGPGWWQASDGKWYAPELYPKDWPVPNQAVEATRDTPAHAAPESAPRAAVAEIEAEKTPRASVFDTPPDSPPTGSAAEEPEPASGIPAISTADLEPTSVQDAVKPDRPRWESSPVSQESARPAHEAPRLRAADGAVSAPSSAPPSVPISSPPSTAPVDPVSAPSSMPSFEAPPPADSAAPAWDTPAGDSARSAEPAEAADESPHSRDVPGGVLALVGGGALAVGSFLTWADAVGPNISGEINGLTGSNGWGTLVAGLVVASCGALVWTGQRQSWVRAAMFVAACAGLGLAIGSMLDIQSTSDDLPATLRASGVDPEIADATSLDLSLGMWIVLAGGAVSLLAGIIGLARRRSPS